MINNYSEYNAISLIKTGMSAPAKNKRRLRVFNYVAQN